MIAPILCAIVIAVQIGDAVSTILCLRHDGLAEANPIARGFMGRMGVVRASLILKTLAVALALGVLAAPIAPVAKIEIFASVAVLNGWVVIGNLRLLAKVRRSKAGAA